MRLVSMPLVGTAYERHYHTDALCQRLCPPYKQIVAFHALSRHRAFTPVFAGYGERAHQ